MQLRLTWVHTAVLMAVVSSAHESNAGMKLGVKVIEEGPKRARSVIVREVLSLGIAKSMGIKPGDVIVRVNDVKINAIVDFIAALNDVSVSVIWKSGKKFYRATAYYSYTTASVGRKFLNVRNLDSFDAKTEEELLASIAKSDVDFAKGTEKRLKESEASLLKALEANPRDASAHARLAYTQIQLGKVDEAASHARKAAEQSDSDHATTNTLIYQMTKSGKHDIALEIARKRADRHPDKLEHLVEVAILSGRANRTEEALAIANGLPERALDRSDLISKITYGLIRAGKGDLAITVAKAALKVQPDDQKLNKLVAYALSDSTRNDEAIDFSKGLLERFPKNESIVTLARELLSSVYGKTGQKHLQAAELEALLAKQPDNPELNNNLGYVYAEQGRNLERAEVLVRKAVANKPQNPSYLDSLGWVLFQRGKLDEAARCLEQSIAASDIAPRSSTNTSEMPTRDSIRTSRPCLATGSRKGS